MSPRILIIDDEPNVRQMIKLTLEHSGYRAEMAADGAEGLEMFGDGTDWAAVLVDQRMPGLTGLDVEKALRDRSPTVKMILITAYGTIDLAMRAVQAGAVGFLRKPFTAETLRASVKSALDDNGQKEISTATIFSLFTRTTINGFRFERHSKVENRHSGEFECTFKVHSPAVEESLCKVILPAYAMELAKAYVDCDTLPCHTNFWESMCEEALAGYLWQHAAMPPNNTLTVDRLTQDLQQWLDDVLTVPQVTDNATR